MRNGQMTLRFFFAQKLIVNLFDSNLWLIAFLHILTYPAQSCKDNRVSGALQRQGDVLCGGTCRRRACPWPLGRQWDLTTRPTSVGCGRYQAWCMKCCEVSVQLICHGKHFCVIYNGMRLPNINFWARVMRNWCYTWQKWKINYSIHTNFFDLVLETSNLN